MVGVFLVSRRSSSWTSGLGLGLAVAVLIDATIIRGVMLPAAMTLLGDWNWYLPSWLEWLPHIGGEDEAPGAEPPAPGDAGAPDAPRPAPVPV